MPNILQLNPLLIFQVESHSLSVVLYWAPLSFPHWVKSGKGTMVQQWAHSPESLSEPLEVLCNHKINHSLRVQHSILHMLQAGEQSSEIVSETY